MTYQVNRRFQHVTDAIYVFVPRSMLIGFRIAIADSDFADMRRRFDQVLTGRVILELVNQDLNDLILLLTVHYRVEQKMLLGSELRQLSFQQSQVFILVRTPIGRENSPLETRTTIGRNNVNNRKKRTYLVNRR